MQVSTQIDVAGANTRLLLSHGAGAGMTSPFMSAFTQLIAKAGLSVTGLEFDYMRISREQNRRRPPPPISELEHEFLEILDAICPDLPEQNIIIAGKSMGGRVASMVAASNSFPENIAGVVCLGYPFHPPGKPDKLRTDHLAAIKRPCLVIQGERDPFGTRSEVTTMKLPPSINLHWLTDGDHDFKPRKRSGVSHRDNLEAAAKTAAQFAANLSH